MNIILAMLPAFLWGTTYSMTQFTLPDWPPLLLGILRALPAGILLFLLKPNWPSKGTWKPLLLIGFINIGIFFCLIFVMAHTLPSAISSVGMMATPIAAMLMQWVISKQKPTPLKIGCGIALLIIAWQLFDPQSIELNHWGLVAMLGAMFCILLGTHLSQTLGQNVDWWNILTWQLIFGGVALIPVVAIDVGIEPHAYIHALSSISWRNISGLIWLSLLNTAIGYALYVWLIQRMSLVDFTFGGIANPIAGISLGVILLHESYTFIQYILMAALILTSLLPQLLTARQREQQTASSNSLPKSS